MQSLRSTKDRFRAPSCLVHSWQNLAPYKQQHRSRSLALRHLQRQDTRTVYFLFLAFGFQGHSMALPFYWKRLPPNSTVWDNYFQLTGDGWTRKMRALRILARLGYEFPLLFLSHMYMMSWHCHFSVCLGLLMRIKGSVEDPIRKWAKKCYGHYTMSYIEIQRLPCWFGKNNI